MTNPTQDAIGRLREIADRLVDQRGEPWPRGSEASRLHYWRDKAIKAADDLRTLLTALDGDEAVERVARALASASVKDCEMFSGPLSDWQTWTGHSRAALNAVIGEQE